MAKEISVTVGLCVKNAEKTIAKCINSILCQKYPRSLVKLVFVDGKSTDSTVKISREALYGSNLSVAFFSDNGEGLGIARQIVLANSIDNYVIWIDSDTIIDENFIEEQVNFMENNPQVCVATGNFVLLRKSGESLPAILENAGKYLGSHTFKPRKDQHGFPPNDTSIYRVAALKQIGGFDTNISGASEDEDVINRMRKKGWLVTVNPTAHYYAFPKASWQSIWRERAWFGRGSHFINHKDSSLNIVKYHVPCIVVLSSCRSSFLAYRLTGEKKTFLFPIAEVLSTTAWWYGYLDAHFCGYGHKKGR